MRGLHLRRSVRPMQAPDDVQRKLEVQTGIDFGTASEANAYWLYWIERGEACLRAIGLSQDDYRKWVEENT